METKICRKCGKELLANRFSKNKKTKDGLRTICRSCVSEYQKQYREKNKEKLKENGKNYRENNLEKIAEWQRKHYENNSEALLETMRKYRQDNSEKVKKNDKKYRAQHSERIRKCQREYIDRNIEKIRKWHKKYKSENLDKSRMSSQIRRAREHLLPHTLTIYQWEKIKLSFDNCCAYCGKEKSLTQEHFLALSMGGEYTINNIIPACGSCNYSKHNYDFFTWYPKYKYYDKKREVKILKYLNYRNNSQQLTFAI